MKKHLAVGAMLLSAIHAFAQPTDNSAPAPDVQAERSRIHADRAREEARYAQEQVACYARFAVNDCLRNERVRRRQVMDELRRQEIALNDAERQRKAQQQRQRTRESSSVER